MVTVQSCVVKSHFTRTFQTQAQDNKSYVSIHHLSNMILGRVAENLELFAQTSHNVSLIVLFASWFLIIYI